MVVNIPYLNHQRRLLPVHNHLAVTAAASVEANPLTGLAATRAVVLRVYSQVVVVLARVDPPVVLDLHNARLAVDLERARLVLEPEEDTVAVAVRGLHGGDVGAGRHVLVQ